MHCYIRLNTWLILVIINKNKKQQLIIMQIIESIYCPFYSSIYSILRTHIIHYVEINVHRKLLNPLKMVMILLLAVTVRLCHLFLSKTPIKDIILYGC